MVLQRNKKSVIFVWDFAFNANPIYIASIFFFQPKSPSPLLLKCQDPDFQVWVRHGPGWYAFPCRVHELPGAPEEILRRDEWRLDWTDDPIWLTGISALNAPPHLQRPMSRIRWHIHDHGCIPCLSTLAPRPRFQTLLGENCHVSDRLLNLRPVTG